MTGKDLIIYILQNNLENEVIMKDGMFVDFVTEEEMAAKFNVGLPTIKAWKKLGMLGELKIGSSLFFMKSKNNGGNK